MISQKITSFLDKKNVDYEQLNKNVCFKIQQNWRRIFSKNIKNQKGVWKYKSFDWHTFSYNFAYYKNGFHAKKLYNSLSNQTFYLISEDIDGLAYRCKSILLPDFSELGLDLYVFSENQEWTMVFTHEESVGFGPFFAYSEWQND